MRKIFSSHSPSSMHRLGLCVLVLTALLLLQPSTCARNPDMIQGHVLHCGHGDKKQDAEESCWRNRMSLPRSRSSHAQYPPPPPRPPLPPVEDHAGFVAYGAEARLIPTGPNPLHN
uniref:Uncharacterized protein n=1 Tax=Kalanchoe fedtschenkoi TaxID=63787 RepID=A0A7N0V2T6_KALFE